MTLIPPYDHPDVIAGQGTAAKELIEEVGAARRAVRLPRRRRPARRLGARGARARAGVQGLRRRARGRQRRPAVVSQRPRSSRIETPRTIADGAQTLHLGEHTFPIIRRDVADIFTATDAELVAAMRFFAERMKMIVEPTGTLGFAAARRMRGRAGRPARRRPDQRRQRRPVAFRRARRRRRALSDARRGGFATRVPSTYTDFGLPARRIDGFLEDDALADRNAPTSPTPSIAMPVGRIDHRSAAELEAALTPLVTAAAAGARAPWCSISPASTTSAASACAC